MEAGTLQFKVVNIGVYGKCRDALLRTLLALLRHLWRVVARYKRAANNRFYKGANYSTEEFWMGQKCGNETIRWIWNYMQEAYIFGDEERGWE